MILFSFLIFGLSWLAQWQLRSKFAQYANTPLASGLSGEETARKMLADNGIRDVQVTSIEGQLTDHYDPTAKTINLSRDVFYGRNAAAVAVAAHECGHAVQHATAYTALQLRSALVPAAAVVSRFVPFVIMGGVLMLSTFPYLLAIGIGLFAFLTIITFVTLPVEFDASRRGLAWLQRSGVVTSQELALSKNALWWAATTYVIAAIGSLGTLLYYISYFNTRRS